MRLQNFLAVFIVIGAIAVAAYFVTNNFDRPAAQGLSAPETAPKEEARPDVLSLKDPLSLTDSMLGNASEKAGAMQNQTDSHSNITDAFAEAFAAQIAEKNKDGPQEKDGQPAVAIPSLTDVLSGFAATFSTSSAAPTPHYHPRVLAGNLKISPDTSPEAQVAYLNNLGEIGASYFSGFSKSQDEILEEINNAHSAASAKQFAKIYGAIADKYSTVSIPANWSDFHKAFLSHLYVAEDTWNAIANFESDPMKSIAFIQFLGDLNQSALGVRVLINEGIKNNHLKW